MLSKFRKLATDSLIYSGGRIASMAIAIFLVPILTRIFSPEDYGTIELLMTINGILLVVLILGTDSGQTRYFYDSEQEEYRHELVSTTLYFRILWGVLIVGICMLAAPLFNQIIFQGEIPNTYFYIIFLSVLFAAILSCLITVYRLLLRPKPYLALTLSQALLSPAIILLLVVYFNMGIEGYLIGSAVSIMLILLANAILLRRYIVLRFSRTLTKKMLKFGFPLMPTGIAIWVMNFADRYFLAQYATLTDVGLYAVGAKLGLAIGLITQSFRLAWTPLALSAAKEPDAKAFYRNVADIYLVGASFIVLILTGISKPVIMLLTQPDYYEAYKVSGILAYGAVFHGLYVISGLGVWLGEKTIFSTIAITISAIVNIALNIVFIQLWGVMGAAIATLGAYIVGNALLFYFGERYYPIGFNYRGLGATVLITSAGIGLQLLLLSSNWSLPLQYGLIVLIWAVIGLLFAFKIIGRDRLHTVRVLVLNYLQKRKGA